MKDIYVLSRAGMHLTVLELSVKPSIEYAFALARVGQTVAALEMSRRYIRTPAARSLFGLLASEVPQDVIPLVGSVSGLEEVSAYCRYSTGYASAVLRQTSLSPPHRLSLALAAGDIVQAKSSFHALFSRVSLSVPLVSWLSTGIDFNSLECIDEMAVLMAKPLISVILTAHNEEECIGVAVKSLLVQTWQNIEVIIVDDASTDGTYALAEEFSRRDCRIKVVRLDQNVGLWGAKNVGLQHCSGDFVTMHDADDWSHPQKLELQVYPLLADTCLQATSSYMMRVDQKTGIPFTRNARNYLRWNPSSFMFRAKLVVELGGFIDSLLGSDCEFIARAEIAYGVSSHVQIRKPLSIGLQRVRSLSNRYRSADDGLLRLRHWEDWRLWHSGKKSQSEPKKIMSPPKIRSSQGWASNC